MRLPVRLLAVCLSMAVAAPVHAQLSATATLDTSAAISRGSAPDAPAAPSMVIERTHAPSALSGATITGMQAGVHARTAAKTAHPAMATRANLGQARAMMVVGVAALIAGAIIGGTPGTVIMVGGAVVGLLGLYDYLQ